jgi:hypothetical protein
MSGTWMAMTKLNLLVLEYTAGLMDTLGRLWLRIATTNSDPRLLQDTILTVSVRLEVRLKTPTYNSWRFLF